MTFDRFRPAARALLKSKLRHVAVADQPMPPPAHLAPHAAPDAGMLRQLAGAAQGKRDWAAACALWRRATEAEPDDAGSWVQLGNMLNELARRRDAIAAFRRAGLVDPALADAPAGVAGVHERAGEWTEAVAAWQEAIALLSKAREGAVQDQLAHAYGHAAMAARLAGQGEKAVDLLIRASDAVPDFHGRPANYLVRAQLIRAGDPDRAADLLQLYLEAFPDDAAARYELASVALARGSYEAGLAALMPAFESRGADPSFLWLQADLNQRLGRWDQVEALSSRAADLDLAAPRYLERAFEAAVRLGRLGSARRTARLHSRRFGGDLSLVQLLVRAYEDAGELGRARLLCRWLSRKRPLTRWHLKHYVVLTAVTRSLPEADRIVRAELAAGRHDEALDQAYCDAAVRAGDHAEALRRLRHHTQAHPHDEGMQVLLGYVLANAMDLDAAEGHFAALASRTYQGKGALTGLAHMAMRRHDTAATHERWSRLATLYPEDTVGYVEYARSAYEMRLYALARQVCEDRLRALPGDVTMGEFYAWLLAATACFGEAWAYLQALRLRTGPSWAVAELSVQCAAAVGALDAAAPAILGSIPGSETREAGRRFYHVVRQLACAGRLSLLPAATERLAVPPRHLAWLHPYLDGAGPAPVDPRLAQAVRASWERYRALVSDATAQRLRTLSDAEVAALIARPAYEQPVVHVVNKFEQMRGGSELHALDVAARIGRHAKVRLWAPDMPHPHFSRDHGVQAVDIGRGVVPQGGVLVLIGVYFDVDTWIGKTHPSRVAILYNTFEAPLLFERIEEIHARTGVRPELIFCSDLMRQECGLPGHFEPSPTDIEMFAPAPARPAAGSAAGSVAGAAGARPFTVGRHSRDVVEKHHPDDWRIYEAAAGEGGVAQVLGGTCMAASFPPVPGLGLLPARGQGIAEFLQGLDAFFYRTSTWVEPWGRVVIEAMACGLPVLVHERGGYAQAIEHGKNGLLFSTTEEGEALMRRLATEPDLRASLGREARRSAEAMLGRDAMARLVAFYLADG